MTDPAKPSSPFRSKPILIAVGAVVLVALVVGAFLLGSSRSAPTAVKAVDEPKVGSGPVVVPSMIAPVKPAVTTPVAQLGQSINYPDGLSVSIAPAERRTAGKYASPPQFQSANVLMLTITVANTGSTPIEVTPVASGPTVTYGGQEAPRVYDRDFLNAPQTTVLPGKSFTYRCLYGVGAQAGELQAQWSRDYGSTPAIFTGQG